MPVIAPAIAPANIENIKAIKGLTPLIISIADTLAPKVKLPSADKSANLRIS